MLGQRDAGQHDLEPRAGWLVHLAEDQAHLVQKPGLLQFVVQLVPFTNPLADAGEDARSLMSLDDIVDELQGQEALAQCGAAENARLAAFDHRIQEVDDLDAGLQNLVAASVHFVGVQVERRRPLPDGQLQRGLNLALPIDGFSRHIDDAAEHLLSHRHLDRGPQRGGPSIPGDLVGGGEGDTLGDVVPMCSSTSRTTRCPSYVWVSTISWMAGSPLEGSNFTSTMGP